MHANSSRTVKFVAFKVRIDVTSAAPYVAASNCTNSANTCGAIALRSPRAVCKRIYSAATTNPGPCLSLNSSKKRSGCWVPTCTRSL